MNVKEIIIAKENNTLLHNLYGFLKENNLAFNNIPATELSKTKLRQAIYFKGIVVNEKRVKSPTMLIKAGDSVSLPNNGIQLKFKPHVVEQKKPEVRIEKPAPKTESEPKKDSLETIDNYILDYFQKNLNCNSVSELKSHDPKKGLCYTVCLIQEKGFDAIKNSDFSYELTDYLKDSFVKSGLVKELDFEKKQLNFSGQIVDALLRAKSEKEQEIKSCIQELKDGLHNHHLYRFLQNYSKITSSITFQYLLNPLLPTTLCSRAAIENLITPINEAYSEQESELRYVHYETCRKIYEDYISNFSNANPYTQKLYSEIGNFLFNLFKEVCDATVEKAAKLELLSTAKKYNFNYSERTSQELFIFMKNSGEGLAKNIRISSLSSHFIFPEINVGMLKSDELREVTIPAKILPEANSNPLLKITIQWEESSGAKEQKEISVKFELQDSNVPWDVLNKQNPYSIQIIEEKNKLFGRDEILQELENNVLSSNIESYKIWGQKRVGKSSIVKTLKSIFKDSEDILIIYRSVLGLRNPDPIKTLNDLGESICSEIVNEIENKVKSPNLRDQIKAIPIPTFDGSFYPLEKFLSKLYSVNNKFRFVFIIDEFDRINEEFFKANDLGEGFSGSIGKALNEKRYVGFILVGSENMQILDRQGMNYNAYHEHEVDTFKKSSQYDSFKNIVLGPVKPHITYTEDSIEKIFEITNGNPFFTNLICNQAFKIAFKNRDSFIDIHLINEAIERIVNSSQKSHFEHFWGDGLTEESDAKKEKTTDIRRRVLVSFSLSSKSDSFPTKNDILRNFKYPEEYKIEKFEVENIITEFFNRKIFSEQGVGIRIKPLLFEQWLCGPGKALMIEGVADLEALHRQIELEHQFLLKDDELKKLSETLEYRGKAIPVELYRDYFKQFGSSIEQRKIFKLLDSIFYLSKDEVNEFFRGEQKNIYIRKDIVLKSNVHTYHREGVEVYCFPKTIEENRLIYDSFKIMSHIKAQKTCKNLVTEKDVWRKNDAQEIVILESVVDDTDNLLKELNDFISDEIKTRNIPIRLVALVITSKAKTNIIKATAAIPNFKLIVYKEIEETKIKPFIPGTEIFENTDEANQAFAEVRKKFPMVSRNSLLVLFSSICPAKSCPILWHQSTQFKPLFLNEFAALEQLNNKHEDEEGEARRDKLYFEFKEFTQKLNKYIIGHLKEKAKNDGGEDWFILKYIPRRTLDNVNKKWLDEGGNDPKESYFDFIDYKEIIQLNKELTPIFMIGSKDQFKWLDEFNKLRRDPAHWEKPVPTIEEVEYFDNIKKQILPKITK